MAEATAVFDAAPSTRKAPFADPAAAVVAEALKKLEQIAAQREAEGRLDDLSWFSVAELESMYKIGHDLFKQERYPDASSVFCMLATLHPEEPRYLMAHAVTLKLLKRYSRAAMLFEKLRGMEPDSMQIALHLAECLIGQNRRLEAIAQLRDVLDAAGEETGTPLARRAMQWLSLLKDAA